MRAECYRPDCRDGQHPTRPAPLLVGLGDGQIWPSSFFAESHSQSPFSINHRSHLAHLPHWWPVGREVPWVSSATNVSCVTEAAGKMEKDQSSQTSVGQIGENHENHEKRASCYHQRGRYSHSGFDTLTACIWDRPHDAGARWCD